MAKQTPPAEQPDVNPQELATILMDVGLRSQKLIAEYAARSNENDEPVFPDPVVISKAFARWSAELMKDPTKLIQTQMAFWQDYAKVAETTLRRLQGEEVEPALDLGRGDRRFKDDAWNENPTFNYLKDCYLLMGKYATTLAESVDGIDARTKLMVDFYTRQIVDAFAPTNFALTNPEVLRATVESKGENLVRGLEHMLADMELGGGKLKIRMTDIDKFEVGKNLAVTPGKVVFQNELMQLLQYEPTTEQVYKRPRLIVPPWINKFYIRDLGPQKSFIKWAVDQGHTVFVISWVNPDASQSDIDFDDYMELGIMKALDAIEQATGEKTVNHIGYCIGGTLTAATLAYMAKKGDDRIASVTYFTTMVDFEIAGDIKVFVDEEQLESLDEYMERDGYLDGSIMNTAFSLLRSNDLVWSFVINNYLLGKDPMPFDLLYWNSDATRLPAMMHNFYLHSMYHENKLSKPGGIEMKGVPIDLRDIKVPTCIVAAKEDHIAPWVSCYKGTQLYSGPVKFILGGSGHIAGIVNPADSKKYGYWTNDKNPPTPEEWFETATQHEGSWWPHWKAWVARKGGGKVKARKPGGGKLKPIEDAPGSYVKATTPKTGTMVRKD